MTLTVLMGPPAAGKTYWLRAHAGGVVCSTEVLKSDRRMGNAARRSHVEQMHDQARRALAAGHDVIVDACNTRGPARTRWLTLGRELGTRNRLVVVHAPVDVLLARQRKRATPLPAGIVASYAEEMRAALSVIDHEGWDEVEHVDANVAPAPRRKWWL